jgi:hypothetical protein
MIQDELIESPYLNEGSITRQPKGGLMKKPIVISMIMALTLFSWSSFAPAYAQDPSNEEKPTFYRLTPGVYVNGWPRFTISYPKDWVEKRRQFLEVFRAEPPAATPRSQFGVHVFSNPNPVDRLADVVVIPFFRIYAQDLTIVSDKSTRLRDGTPAREVESQMVLNGEPIKVLNVAAKKGDMWINIGTRSYSGRIEEYQRAMLYSLQCEPGKDEPVKVPPDVQEFLDRHCNDLISHDLAKFMTHYSDRYLNSGTRKGEMERFWRQMIGHWTSAKWTITDFVPAGDRAYLTGFVIAKFAKTWVTETATNPITDTSIIKENGEWKWYGNQRDVSP